MPESRFSKFRRDLSEDEFYQKLSDLSAPRWDRAEPVVRVAGHVGSVVGKVIGWVVGWSLVVISYLLIWFAFALYLIVSAIRAWRDEEYRTEYERRKISQRERYEIAKSQYWKCHYGDMPLPSTGFHIDHKTPVADVMNYGADPDEIEDLSNLVATCPKHNLQKGDMDEDEFWDWMEQNRQISCDSRLGE